MSIEEIIDDMVEAKLKNMLKGLNIGKSDRENSALDEQSSEDGEDIDEGDEDDNDNEEQGMDFVFDDNYIDEPQTVSKKSSKQSAVVKSKGEVLPLKQTELNVKDTFDVGDIPAGDNYDINKLDDFDLDLDSY
jgi:hypothetical protein